MYKRDLWESVGCIFLFLQETSAAFLKNVLPFLTAQGCLNEAFKHGDLHLSGDIYLRLAKIFLQGPDIKNSMVYIYMYVYVYIYYLTILLQVANSRK